MSNPAAPTIRAEYKTLQGGVYLNITAPATSSAPVTSVRIDRWDGTSMLYATLTTLVGTDRFHFDTDLDDGQVYAYRALSINGDGSTFSSPSAKVYIIDPPAQPTGVTAEKATAEAAVGVNWTPVASTRAPYSGAYVMRSDNGGPIQQVNKVVGATGFVADTPPADTACRYRIWAYNGAGTARFYSDFSGTVYTVPAAVTGLTAGWSSEGELVASWTNPSVIAERVEVERSSDNVEWYPIPAPASGNSLTYANAERGVGHYVRVRNVSPAPTLGAVMYSAWTTSALVAADSSDAAPSVTGPDYADPSSPIALQVAGAKALTESRWRLVGGEWSAAVAGLSVTVPSTAIGPIDVAVRTRATSGDAWSIWSAPRQVLIRRAPAPRLLTPSAGTVAGSPVLVSWEGRAVPYVVTVTTGGTTTTYEGIGTSVPVVVANGLAYTIGLSTSDGYLWSDVETVAIAATFSSPAAPTIAAVLDGTGWAAQVTVTHASPGTVRLDLYADDAEDAWRLVQSGVTSGVAITHLPRFGGQQYKAVATSATFGRSESAPAEVDIPANQVAVSGGGLHAVLTSVLNFEVSDVPERSVVELGSRRVEFTGPGRTYTVAVSGQSVNGSGSAPEVWRAVMASEELHYRDPLGHSWPCSITGGVPYSTSWREQQAFSFTAERLGDAADI